jgi:glycosyltransferase involved in cell wall biosynthesis
VVLGIVSDCIHTQTPDGKTGSGIHIFVRQMQALAAHFDQVVICCPFRPYKPGENLTAYSDDRIRFIPLPLAGGDNASGKLSLLKALPAWIKAFGRLHRQADVVYQRFPNNLNIPGFFYFRLKGAKTFATYTGTWKEEAGQPFTYRLQKWLLRNWFKGPVFVYDEREKAGRHIYGSFSPSYTMKEWNEETDRVAAKMQQWQQPATIRMITVGILNENKNQQYLLQSCVLLKQAGIPFQLVVAGEGPLRQQYEAFIATHGLQHQVTLTGLVNYQQLRALYRESDLVVQAAISEGFGKVPVEGFFHGLIPVLHQSALAPYMTGNGERGFLFNAHQPESLFQLLANWFNQHNAARHIQQIGNGRAFAQTQTLENWASQYVQTIHNYFD